MEYISCTIYETTSSVNKIHEIRVLARKMRMKNILGISFDLEFVCHKKNCGAKYFLKKKFIKKFKKYKNQIL